MTTQSIASSLLQFHLAQLRNIISIKLEKYFHQLSGKDVEWNNGQDLFYYDAIKKTVPEIQSQEEWMIIYIALAPHISANFYDSLIQKYLPGGGEFAEFGGVKGTNSRAMIPTGETVQFLLAGNDVDKRVEIQKYFSSDHLFCKEGILWLEPLREGEPKMSGKIIIAPEWIEFFLTGVMPPPEFNAEFPAKIITTGMEWSDLILHPFTFDLLDDIRNWLEQHKRLEKDVKLSPKIKPGYRALFHGPPGTGKTLTASLLGKEFQKEVFRIDLSMVVSKYIGETEKNLSRIFDKAMNKNWILFFDEADALFGKRTNVQSSHDRYANQEVSYLLQRVEDYPGLLILASNFKSNIDEAFLRRFNTIIHFPKPNPAERLKHWNNCIPDQLKLDEEVNLPQLSAKYELTGAMIVNIMQYAAIRTFANNEKQISIQTIMDGIRKEFNKDEKSIL